MIHKRHIILALAIALCFAGGCSNSQVVESEAADAANESEQPVIEQVVDQEMTLPIQNWNDDYTELKAEETRDGKYTGQLIDGVPNGQGKFESQSPEGLKWYYEGEFTDGRMTGVGKTVYDEENSEDYVGHFTNSAFTPTEVEWYKVAIPSMTQDFSTPLTLDDTTASMIEANPEYFPATDDASKAKVQSMVDSSIEYRHLSKNVTPYRGKFIYFKNQIALQVFSYPAWGHTYTSILACDQNYTNHHYLTYYGDIDVYDGDTIAFISAPYSYSSFQNVGGGETNIIAEIASIVVKS